MSLPPCFDPHHTHTHRAPTMSTTTTTRLTVATYRGIDLGWVPCGRPRTKPEAARLLALVDRIRPDYLNKTRPAAR